MSESEKYPVDSNRRRFVSGVVGGAALAGVGTAAAGVIDATTSATGEGGGPTQYVGAENVAGPAPRALPQIPVRIDDEGFLQGLWPEPETVTEGDDSHTAARTTFQTESGPVTYSGAWFQYCGVQTYPGLDPEADQDQYLRYAGDPPYDWQREAVDAGDRLHVDDFEDFETWGNDLGSGGVGKPATATWRSEGLTPENTIPVLVIRSPTVAERAAEGTWLGAATRAGFLAVLNKCTHFCCVPGFKTSPQSRKFDAEDEIYCSCHQSVYDPFSLVRRTFVALPRPE